MLIALGLAEGAGLGAEDGAGTSTGEFASKAKINARAIVMGMIRHGGYYCFAEQQSPSDPAFTERLNSGTPSVTS
jgi:hypothetical protein